MSGDGLRGRASGLVSLGWFARGLRSGVLTTRYPAATEAMPANWRGVVALDPDRCRPEGALPPCVAACLPGALTVGPAEPDGERQLRLDAAACIACGRCIEVCPQGALTMTPRFELAMRTRPRLGQATETLPAEALAVGALGVEALAAEEVEG